MAAEQTILENDQGSVRFLRFNRPEKRNAFSVAMYEEFIVALEKAAKEPSVRAVVLCGEGAAFTAGNDLVDFQSSPPTGPDSAVFRLLLAVVDYEKPLIAAVNGPAVGIGTTLLLHCDLVLASPLARFQLPFVNLGLVPEGGSTFLLPALTGHRNASELLLLGEPFSAERAKEAGIVNRVVPAEELEGAALTIAQKVAAQPAASIREAKRLLKAPTRDAVREAIEREALSFIERLTSPEAAEAFIAFFEKRKPDFSKFD